FSAVKQADGERTMLREKSCSRSNVAPSRFCELGCLKGLVNERASWWDLISCPKIHLQDGTGFNCHHSCLNLSPCSQDSCPQKKSLTTQTLATDPLTLGKASTPPTKRHCCSSSVSKDLTPWQPLWRPLGSKVWTPIKHQGNGDHALEEQPLIPVHGACSFRFDQASGTLLQRVQSGGGSSPPFFSLSLSRASPVSMLWESGKTLRPLPLQRRFSLSPVRFLPSPWTSSSSTLELLRCHHGLPRSQSQPCDLDTKKSGLQRCHDEDVRWHRPSLDFYNMNQKRFSRALHFLGKSEEGSASSWFLAGSPQAPSAPCSSYGQVLSEEEEDEARSRSWHRGSKRTFFQQDFSDLDLNLIEEN
uniref:Family with sequence similarity 53 member C n=1 Tax=Pelusios castaneus TaxID=367368 RepID=A0A8C8SJX1_9SAUR